MDNNFLTCDWQVVIKAIPCLCWGILGVVFIYLGLKYAFEPWLKAYNERKMKQKAFDIEKEWYNLKNNGSNP